MNPADTSRKELTDKESALLSAITEGMDQPGCGWLHELSPFDNSHITAGVLSSLIGKGLVTSREDPDFPDSYWIELTSTTHPND